MRSTQARRPDQLTPHSSAPWSSCGAVGEQVWQWIAASTEYWEYIFFKAKLAEILFRPFSVFPFSTINTTAVSYCTCWHNSSRLIFVILLITDSMSLYHRLIFYKLCKSYWNVSKSVVSVFWYFCIFSFRVVFCFFPVFFQFLFGGGILGKSIFPLSATGQIFLGNLNFSWKF